MTRLFVGQPRLHRVCQQHHKSLAKEMPMIPNLVKVVPDFPLPRSGQTTDDLKSRDEFAGGTYSYQSEIDGRIVPAAVACPTICTIFYQLYHSDYCAAASARNITAFMLLNTNDSSVYVPTASSTLLFSSSVVGSL